MSCGTRRHEARPGYVRLLKVRDGAGAKDPRLDPQALSELQEHPLPQGETLEVTSSEGWQADISSRSKAASVKLVQLHSVILIAAFAEWARPLSLQ